MKAIAECRLQSIAYSGIVYRKLNRLEKTLLGWGGSIINFENSVYVSKISKKNKIHVCLYFETLGIIFMCTNPFLSEAEGRVAFASFICQL